MSDLITTLLTAVRRPTPAPTPDWARQIDALHRECDALLRRLRSQR